MTTWQDFIALYHPLTEEIEKMAEALKRIELACESLRVTYRDLEEWCYQFNRRGIE